MSLIQFKDISKVYPNCISCEEIQLTIEKSEIHAIVGENGAGKSTLMKILGGLVIPTTGSLQLNSQVYQPSSALDAFEHKIAFIHQHFELARQMTAFENILLSCSSNLNALKVIPRAQIRAKTEELLKRFNWSIHLDKKVEHISVGEQQRLEIIKALLLEPEIIIFDEPTAVLTPQESDDLLNFLLQLKKQNKTILLISHKLGEIKKVADTVTIMRAGKIVFTKKNSDLTLDQMAEAIIGRKSQKSVKTKSAPTEKKLMKLPGSQIDIFNSEIFGVAGIEGHGQSHLIQKLIEEFKKMKLSYGDITEDRIPLSVFQNSSLIDHVVLKHPQKVSRNGFINRTQAISLTEKLIQQWDVRPGLAEQSLNELSGGNQQKFIVGRELLDEPDALIAAHPTRGVDLGAQEFIHKALIDFSRRNRTVFLVSSDLEEVLQLSDRYVILYHNKILGPFLKNSLSEMQIGLYMTGQLK